MKTTLFDSVLRRELGHDSRYSKIKALYGDRQWVNDLDIVNELGGHSGCVNALSWSRSGKFLASGSDDQHINIHSYQPDCSTSQFDLTTTVATGHKANIFSVKFMPHSNDRVLVSAAGDSEVRIFDIEYAGRTTTSSDASNRAFSARSSRANMYNAQHLTDGNTNAKIFRSHSDRVKRIVTESSPWLFLTCSEDGEVRQWDIRQPSSTYPAAGSFARQTRNDPVPPPLISYKRYHLDLNTISCSPSQPHYIALGGAHLHCFLHDRRMTGRDRLAERGASLNMSDKASNHDDELFGQATQCVRKFAPNGQKRMKRVDNGHITACKISDANPNEIVVSWSGESIYSFDLIRSPDANEPKTEDTAHDSRSKTCVKDSTLRKRKRTRTGVSAGSERPNSRPRAESEEITEGDAGMALMVHYENGQSEEIPIEGSRPRGPTLEERNAMPLENQLQVFRIAKMTVKMRSNLFAYTPRDFPTESDPTGFTVPFSAVLEIAMDTLPQIDEISRTWRYPVDPSPVDVRFQNSLRENRSSVRRFVQAAGTLARVVGGRLRNPGNVPLPGLSMFEKIVPAPRESPNIPRREQFSLDFLKAILLWLDSGVGALVEGFAGPPDQPRENSRFPVPEDAGIDAIDEYLIPYLLRLAGDRPILDLQSSVFAVDQDRNIFQSEKDAVVAFSRAVKLPFADLSRTPLGLPVVLESVLDDSQGEDTTFQPGVQHRNVCLRFWGFRVGRGVLVNAGEGIDFAFVDRALGGCGRPDVGVRIQEMTIDDKLRIIDPEEDDPVVESASIGRVGVVPGSPNVPQPTVEGIDDVDDEGVVAANPISTVEENEANEDYIEDDSVQDHDTDFDRLLEEQLNDEDNSSEGLYPPFPLAPDDDDSEYFDEDDDDDEEEDYDNDEGDYDADEMINGPSNIIFRSAFERTKLKEKAELDKPCSTHTRRYGGHCNVKTVKDVNFYGLQDEYVVSGSDSGHFFIWDKKTTRIVNILEGDGEVVNVVQGHPYEPVIAVSGIDHTIKIFSPDAHARDNARLGIGVSPGDSSAFSSINLGRIRRRQRPTSHPANTNATPSQAEGDEEEEDVVAPGGLPSRKRMADEYQIISENDVTRQGGNRSYITRGMLAELAQRFYMHPQLGDDEGDESGGPAMLDNNEQCAVM